MINNIYSWQHHIWYQLLANRQRFPHAILLHGRAGIGKYDFSRQLSQSLLCLQPDGTGAACQQCASCNWYKEEGHPDFRLLSPEQEDDGEQEVGSTKKTRKKTQISVTQIRDLSNFLGLSSHRSEGLRIVLIHPAESLNIASANALLKMLEEPAPGVLFILVSHHLQRLIPTILSRCQKIQMPVPTEAEALAWLNEQGVQHAAQQLAYLDGSPIKVLNEQSQFEHFKEVWRLLALGNKLEPHLVAPLLLANSVESGISALQKWIYDIVAIKMADHIHYHLPYVKALQVLAEKVNLNRLFDLQKNLMEMRKLATHPLNHELQMENLLVEYTKAFKN
ncbi:MAG: DNA polymerase III subunit delta' [Methylotenera sp.]|nr:MAG: DNA polymerase III subunit delta' [Methylotenera sp.]